MTFVDDNMLAASPARSARSGAKSAGNGQDMDAAGQRSAFENAFADAGKKKQPVVSITGNAGAEDSAADQTLLQDMKIAEAEAGHSSSRQGAASEEGFMKSTFENSSSPALRAFGKTIAGQDGEHGLPSSETAQKFTLKRTGGKGELQGFAGIDGATADAGKTIDGPLGETLAGLLKGDKADPSKGGGATETSDDALPANPSGDAASADVSQLLSLLDAAHTPAAANQAASGAAPVMSELQTLAERAGKAKADAKGAIPGKAGAHQAGDANAVKNATEAGSDQVFRFARADGKGQAVSMNLGSDGDKTVVKNETASPSAKAEAVTVLEARRYLGLAPSSNAAAVTSQIASNPEWARTIQSEAAASASPVDAAAGKVLNTLKIQMHPIDLGMVTATLRLKDDELQVEIKVETGDAFRQLSDDQSGMVKALRAQGFAVDQVNIVFNASDSSGGSNQQQAQSQAGQHGRETAGDGAKGQRNDNGAREQGREGWTGNGGTGDASSGAEPGRTGDVYM
jgi:chemotaxis protein MotD